jgi:cytoskeletal protein RodZ
LRAAQIGEIFKDKREELNITLDKAYLVTRIPRAELELMEDGNLENLPVNFFTHAKIVRYAKFLQLEPKVISALYRREVIGIKPNEPLRTSAPNLWQLKLKNFANKNRGILGLAAFFLVVAFVVFINPILGALAPAQLVINVPFNAKAGQTANFVTNGNSVSFEGNVSQSARLVVNGMQIDIEPGGNFITPEIPLPLNTQTINILAINPIGAASNIQVVVSKKDATTVLEATVSLKVTSPDTLQVLVDGVQVHNQEYNTGDVLTLKAFTSIQVKSGKESSYEITSKDVRYPQIGTNSVWQVLAGRLLPK